MNTLQIDNILKRYAKDCYKGIFSSNTIKLFDKYPYAIVINTDRFGQPGTHWVCVYVISSNCAEYFDSLALKPNQDIQTYLDNFKFVKRNVHQLQNLYDTSCGSFCIYFLINRCKGMQFEDVIKKLKNPFSDMPVKLYTLKLIEHL